MASVSEIIDRMIQACGAKNQQEMQEFVPFAPGTASKWRKRNAVPDGSIAKVAAKTGANFHWLKTGKGEIFEDEKERRYQPGGLDKELVRVVIEAVEEGLNDLQLELKPDKKAQLVITLCEMFQEEKQVDKPTILRLIKLAA